MVVNVNDRLVLKDLMPRLHYGQRWHIGRCMDAVLYSQIIFRVSVECLIYILFFAPMTFSNRYLIIYLYEYYVKYDLNVLGTEPSYF